MRVALVPEYLLPVPLAVGADAATDERPAGAVAASGLQVRGFADLADLADADLRDIGFYVPPPMVGTHGLDPVDRMPGLEVCQMLTAGVEGARERLPGTVVLCNAAGVHDASTAELAVGLMLARLRRIDEFARAQPVGAWLHDRYDALADRRVLIVGAGGVGRAIASRLEPFEVELTMVARTARPDAGVHGLADLPTLLPRADVVVLAVPLTEQTHGMVDRGFLAAMPDGALLVNVARGPVVVTDDLLAELAAGRLRAALDVTDPEPLPADHPLWRMPGALISPHVGGNTTAFVPRARRLVAGQVQRWLSGQPLVNVVTAEA